MKLLENKYYKYRILWDTPSIRDFGTKQGQIYSLIEWRSCRFYTEKRRVSKRCKACPGMSFKIDIYGLPICGWRVKLILNPQEDEEDGNNRQ